jgi:hypothetical protein
MRKSGRALFGPKGFWMRIWPLLAGDAPQVLDATVSLKALNIEVVSAVGPVDASLLTRAISLRAEERDVHVITGDEEFYKRYQQVVPMIWIDEILYPGPV